MMNQLLDMLTSEQNQSNLSDIAEAFGLDAQQTSEAVSALLPAVSKGIQTQVSSENGSILDTLSNAGLQQLLDDDSVRLTDASALETGTGVVGQLFGDDGALQSVITGAAEKTGVDAGILEQILPMVSSMALGSIGKQLGNADSGNIMGMVTAMVDTDNDGLDIDDIKNIAGKFFG